METSENNNMSELDMLKEQYDVLKEKFSQLRQLDKESNSI